MLTATRIAAIVAALALGTTFVAVQVGDPPDTAQQPAAPTGETWITVTGTQDVGPGGGGGMAGQRLNMSDPRFEGDVRIEYEQEDADNSGLNSTVWSTVTITNDEGSWAGQSIGFVDQQGFHHHMGWFEGAGAYEGLAYIEQLTEPQLSGGLDLDVVGLVYEGELPPMVLPSWTPATD